METLPLPGQHNLTRDISYPSTSEARERGREEVFHAISFIYYEVHIYNCMKKQNYDDSGLHEKAIKGTHAAGSAEEVLICQLI